jgi:hypothetical protein
MVSKDGRRHYRNALRMRQLIHVHVFSCIKFVKHYYFKFMKSYFSCDTLRGPHVSFTNSDPNLFKMYAKLIPELYMGTSKWNQRRSEWARWSQVDPRGAQVLTNGGRSMQIWLQERPR